MALYLLINNNMKSIAYLAFLLQIVSGALHAQSVEFVDNRWYETQEEAEKLAAQDAINGINLYPANEYPEQYQKVQSVLNEVYEAAKNNLSPYYKNIPPRPVVVLTDMDAMLPLRIDGEMRSSNILYIRKDSANSSSLRGVIAHEISHYILDHGKEDQEEEIETVKSITTTNIGESIICSTIEGYKTGIPEGLKEVVDFMLSKSMLIEEDTRDVPFDIQYDTDLTEALMTSSIFGKYDEKQPCQKASDLRDTIAVDIYAKYCSLRGIQECRIPEKVKGDLVQLTEEFKKEATLCLENENTYFQNKLKEKIGDDTFRMLSSFYESNDYSSFSRPRRAKFTIEQLFSNNNPMRILMNIYSHEKDSIDKDFKELGILKEDLRLLTSEDEADMLAQVILDDEVPNINSFAVSRLQYMTDEEKSYCQEKVSRREMPNYGFISDTHHSQCWRYWRSRKLKNELKNPEKKKLLIKTLLDRNLKALGTENFLN